MKSLVGYLSMISVGLIASVVLANGTLGPQGLLGALPGFNSAEIATAQSAPTTLPSTSQPPASSHAPASPSGPLAGYEVGPQGSSATAFQLDYASLILGLVVGVLLSSLAAIPWSQIPRRTANWLVSNQANFGYGVLSIGFAALLIYY